MHENEPSILEKLKKKYIYCLRITSFGSKHSGTKVKEFVQLYSQCLHQRVTKNSRQNTWPKVCIPMISESMCKEDYQISQTSMKTENTDIAADHL